MRDDLTWSDGKPITAHDVAFTFLAIMTSKVPATAVRSGTDELKWVEAYDDHTVVYFHKAPRATNVWNVNFPVLPKHIYESSIGEDPTLVNIPKHVELENNPVSGNAYVFRSRTRGQEIILDRRDDYHMHNGKQVRDKPYFKTIRFRIRPEPATAVLSLKAGDIDEMELTPEQWQTQTNDADFYRTATKARGVEWTSFHFLWNCQTPFFSDKRVRQAMTFAFDHEEMLKRLRYGLDQPANGPFYPTSKWAPQPPQPFFKQDLDKAEDLLDAAGWKDSDSDGIRDKVVDGKRTPFEFTVLVLNAQDRIDMCTLLKQCLDQIGIRCNIKPLELAALFEKERQHDFQAAYGGWGTGADPYTAKNIFGTREERNYGQYSNAEVDRLFIEGEKELDTAKRPAIYQRIHSILYEDQPYTWLYYRNSYYGFNRSLRGYVFSPRGPYHYGPGFSSLWKPVAH
jgi:peptide/nickel transport system substrate-binding protein